MDKQVAQKLLFFVNDPKTYEDFLSVLDYKVNTLKERLVNAQGQEQVLQLQGAIKELRNLTSLKEDIQQRAK